MVDFPKICSHNYNNYYAIATCCTFNKNFMKISQVLDEKQILQYIYMLTYEDLHKFKSL